MIVVTGAAGFIGSCLIHALNEAGFTHIVGVDDFSHEEKQNNYKNLKTRQLVERTVFEPWLELHARDIEFIFHLGARTDTTEFNKAIFDELNEAYSQMVWKKCVAYQIPLVYASSAATYGNGELGYDDDEKIIEDLKPLNPYGVSKNNFDIWALQQNEKPFFWAGLKFFNVYGPNEYHKGRMASVILHAYRQIKKEGGMKLFRSHNPKYTDGGQMRDFVYVKDLVQMAMFLMHHRKNSGLYNVGSGQARTFLDLVHAVFKSMDIEPKIDFIDTPADIRDKYQYFTEANMEKIRGIGFSHVFHTLEEGVQDYVQNYLSNDKYMA